MDKYLEKMVLVSEERWKKLLQSEKEWNEGEISKTINSPIQSDYDKGKEGELEDITIPPPGIPTNNDTVLDIDFSETGNLDNKKLKRKRKVPKLLLNYKWKKLP